MKSRKIEVLKKQTLRALIEGVSITIIFGILTAVVWMTSGWSWELLLVGCLMFIGAMRLGAAGSAAVALFPHFQAIGGAAR